MQWLNPIDAERIEVLGVIGIRKSAAQARPEPVILFSERKLMMENVCRDIGFENAGMDCRIDWAQRNGHLMVGLACVGIDEWYAIDFGESLRKRRRVACGRRSRLELAARVNKEAAGRCISANTRVVVESVLIGTTVVVNDGLAEMKAVVERSAGDAERGGVD